MTHNVAASVHQRLLNRARTDGRPFNELLQYFVLERFLFRLGCSPHARHFVLKGALMFGVWQGQWSRPTRDIDLLGHMDNQVERVVEAVHKICQQPVEDDGLYFDAATVTGQVITEAADYHGVRVCLSATLGAARVPVQIDVGFGDVLVPGATAVQLPTILSFPPPEVQGYSRESAIAEKYQAMVYLGVLNSRMKDFYDVWFLAARTAFDGPTLSRAVHETFHHRHTELQAAPLPLARAFATLQDKQIQWQAFVRRHQLEHSAPAFEEAVDLISALLQPVTLALIEQRSFESHWPPGGPWQEIGETAAR